MIAKLPYWVWGGAWVMAFIAGLVNVVGLLSFGHQAVTHLTGSTSQLAIALEDGKWPAIREFAAILCYFTGGSMLSGFIVEDKALRLGYRYSITLLIQAGLLCVAVTFFEYNSVFALYALAAASGLQNAMTAAFSGLVVRTTHLTGMFTDLGIFLGHAMRGLPVEYRRIRLSLLVIFGFLTGGIVGTYAFRHLDYETLYVPAAITAFTAIGYGAYRFARTINIYWRKRSPNRLQNNVVREKSLS